MEVSPSDFSLRPATEDDLAQVLDIERKSYPLPWAEENFRAEMAKPYARFLVLTDNETDSHLAGYIVFWLLFDECQILNVAVGLEHRGLGFGRTMVRKAVSLAVQKGIRRVTLEVRRSNAAAIQLYQSLRFTIRHVRKGFYANGEDAYVMELTVTDEPQTADGEIVDKF